MQFTPNDSRYASAIGAWLSENFEAQFTNSNALLALLKLNSSIKYGAAYLVQPITASANPSVQGVSNFYAGMTIPPDQGLSAQYTFSWYQGQTVINKAEEVAIGTEYEMVDLLEARLADTIASFAEVISNDLFSTTNATQEKIMGLPYAIDAPTTGTSPVGNIDRVANSWFRANVQDATGTLTLQKMNSMYNICQGRGRAPSVIVMPTDIFGAYESLVLTNTRYATDQRLAQVGFLGYLHKNATVIFDPRCPTGTIFYLNSNDTLLVQMTKEPNAEPVDFPDRLVRGYKHWHACQLVIRRLNTQGRQNGVTV